MTTARHGDRIPAGPDDFDDALLSAALGTEVRIVGREPVGVGVGQGGQLHRLHLAGPTGTPSSVMLKLPPASQEHRAIQSVFDIWRREARFYTGLAPQLPIRQPHCHWSALDDEAGSAVLLLEDLHNWVTPSQVEGADRSTAEQAMQLIAQVHAWGWARAAAFPERLDAAPYDLIGPGYRQCAPAFLERFDHVLPAGSANACRRIAAAYEQIVSEAMRGPITLCHGDFRLENMMFDDTTGACTLIDWQITNHGPAATDVAMFLTQSMDPNLRAEHERDLVAAWHAALARADHPLERAWTDYRRLAMQATMIPVLGGASYDLTNPRTRALMESMAHRAFTAVIELDSLALLP